MIVTFHTKAYADIPMFGNVAKQLLLLMGHSGSVPGALLADDLPAALAKLRAGVAEAPPPEASTDTKDEESRPVSLAHRALPLMQLLEAAITDRENVMWD